MASYLRHIYNHIECFSRFFVGIHSKVEHVRGILDFVEANNHTSVDRRISRFLLIRNYSCLALTSE